jgi:hypothetical protein
MIAKEDRERENEERQSRRINKRIDPSKEKTENQS